MGLNLQEQELVRQALDQWVAQDQVMPLGQAQELGRQWLLDQVAKFPQVEQALQVAKVQAQLVEQVQVQLAQVEQVQVQVVQLAQARVEQSQGRALAQAALELAQEQRRLVRLQLAQV